MAEAFKFESVARTHVGRVRKLNEDVFVERPQAGLWAVADGMGGHQAGEVASGMIAQTLEALAPAASGYAFLNDVRERLAITNHSLLTHAAALGPGSVIGSTIVALLTFEGHFACLWAGDSRAYLLRGSALRQLSKDHSLVQELIDMGELSPAAARNDRRSNVITRAVGVHLELALEVVQGAIEKEDVYLLCSDGLSGLVEDEELRAELAESDLEAVADRLLQLSLERGARDNVTLVLVRANSLERADPDDTANSR